MSCCLSAAFPLSPYSQIVLMRGLSRRGHGRRYSFVSFFGCFFFLFHVLVSNDKRSAIRSLLRPTRQLFHSVDPSLVVISWSPKDDVAPFFYLFATQLGKNSSGKEREKTIIAVIRLSLGVSTFGQNCSPYAHHQFFNSSSNGSVCIRQSLSKKFVSAYSSSPFSPFSHSPFHPSPTPSVFPSLLCSPRPSSPQYVVSPI